MVPTPESGRRGISIGGCVNYTPSGPKKYPLRIRGSDMPISRFGASVDSKLCSVVEGAWG